MKNILWLLFLSALACYSETLFEVKDASNNTVLEVATDGLRIFNQGDTLMVISSSQIKAFVDNSKALSRSFTVATSTSAKNTPNKIFELTNNDGAIFYNPSDNSDEIFSISRSGITANVNPALNRDFEINDQVSSKGSGNLMKISNESVFETVNDSTMLWYKDKNAFRVGHVLITNPDHVGQASFASGSKNNASGDFSTALGTDVDAFGYASTAIGYGSISGGSVSIAVGSSSFAYGDASVAMGSLAEANNNSAVALGSEVYANGAYSLAFGNLNVAAGQSSTAIGYYNSASGDYSTAIGSNNSALGYSSTAIGNNCVTSGYFSTSFGYQTNARPYCSFVVGRYNKIGGTTDAWVDSDALFIVGNGSSTSARSNAFKVEKSGEVFIDSLFSTTSSNTRKLLYVDTEGKLCVASKNSEYTNEDILIVIKENKEMKEKIENQQIRIAKLEEALEKLLK